MSEKIDLSVVVPLLNEVESIGKLCEWIERVCDAEKLRYEVVFVDDGSNDESWNLIENLNQNNPNVKGVKFRRNYGKSAALNVGFQHVKGEVVITMDADLQDSPDEIPELYKMIVNNGYDLVSGWKKKRYDPLSKTIPTKLYNWTTRKLTGIRLHDMNCGLKVYKRQVVQSIELFSEMHRYIPVLAKHSGFNKIGEKEVVHKAREFGKSKFGINRFLNGFLDLLTILFITKFAKKPMHLFGLIGTVFFFFGTSIALWLGIEKLFIRKTAVLLAQNTWFFMGITFMIIGVQLFLAGFVSELIVRHSSTRNHYLIEKEIL